MLLGAGRRLGLCIFGRPKGQNAERYRPNTGRADRGCLKELPA